MNILITGANGFIGKNLVLELKNKGYNKILNWNRNSSETEINNFTKKCNFVIHLAGENRPIHKEDFKKVNVGLTMKLLEKLKRNNNKSPIIFTSSIQVGLDNEYGKTKKIGEELIQKYGKENNVVTYIYRLTNVFGKWCRSNYNSVIATFCNNIARDLEVKLENKNKIIEFTYIDDVVREFIDVIEGKRNVHNEKIRYIQVTYKKNLQEVLNKIQNFKKSRENLIVPNLRDDFTRKLYSTYLSYIPKDDFSYKLNTNIDERGTFTELLKTTGNGQISVNVIKPKCIKGNHWHHTKNEKFIVVNGEGIIKFENVCTKEKVEYIVNDKELKVVDIPTGYVHSIINTGDKDMIVLIWASEVFNKNNPDTYRKI